MKFSNRALGRQSSLTSERGHGRRRTLEIPFTGSFQNEQVVKNDEKRIPSLFLRKDIHSTICFDRRSVKMEPFPFYLITWDSRKWKQFKIQFRIQRSPRMERD
ncbi:hypothetical protein AVEN_138286-1 [Araneus ventricosus]|uniref:Uncharacterized protein n=1 Tax=Araneus ventricosus TaxID=182803 RepID=A0A4Y2ITQ0_ARAVE|nr:hypothetical protein AVEN_138286-1 [Araneus ventricosus]